MQKIPSILSIEHYSPSDPLKGLTVVEINPTELCNRTCSFCPRVDPNVYPNQNLHMTRDTLSSLVNNLHANNYKGRIVFSGMGEPTLNKDILNLIRIAKGRISEIQMYTNGDKILNDEWYTLEEFIEAGLTSIFIDVYDSVDQHRKWEEKIHKLQPNVPIHLSAKYNFPLAAFTNRAGTVKTKGVPQEVLKTPCFLPHTKAFIDWDGSMLLCCNDWARAAGRFGNVNETPFHKLWLSDEMNKVRSKLMLDRAVAGNPCNTCNAIGNQKLRAHVEKVWKI